MAPIFIQSPVDTVTSDEQSTDSPVLETTPNDHIIVFSLEPAADAKPTDSSLLHDESATLHEHENEIEIDIGTTGA